METGGHFYRPDGTPAHFVDCKTRDGQRPTTIADARKLGLYPSVTQVLKCLDKPGLRDWLIKQAVHAVVTAPDELGESLDAKIERILVTEKQQDEEAKRARDLGSEIHAAIEEHLAGRLYAPQFRPYVDAVQVQLKELGRVVASEKVLVHPSGFAGKVDCVIEGNVITILDFKTTKTLPKKKCWPEHELQVSAYAAAFGNTGNKPIQVAVLYVSTVEPGTTALFIEPDWKTAFEVFQATFRVWCWMNAYQPSMA